MQGPSSCSLSLLLHPHDITVIIIMHDGTAPRTSSFKLDGWEDLPISFKGMARSWTHNFFLHSPWLGLSQWATSNRRKTKEYHLYSGGHGSELGAVIEDVENGCWSLPHPFPSFPVFPQLSHRVASP